jgi:hypothetical protein
MPNKKRRHEEAAAQCAAIRATADREDEKEEEDEDGDHEGPNKRAKTA